MELEINTLKAAITNGKETKIGRFSFYEGLLSDTEVVLLLSGIGKVSAAVGAALLIEKYHPYLIINTGTAGGWPIQLFTTLFWQPKCRITM